MTLPVVSSHCYLCLHPTSEVTRSQESLPSSGCPFDQGRDRGDLLPHGSLYLPGEQPPSGHSPAASLPYPISMSVFKDPSCQTNPDPAVWTGNRPWSPIPACMGRGALARLVGAASVGVSHRRPISGLALHVPGTGHRKSLESLQGDQVTPCLAL